MSLGDRLRSIRKRRGLSQRELAEASGVSLSLISKIEQEEVPGTRLETLHKLATALRVSTMSFAVESVDDRATPDMVASWEPVRRALVGRVEQGSEEQPTVEGVQDCLDQIVPAIRANRFSEVLPLLADLIADANNLGPAGRDVRAKVLNYSSRMLVHTHQYDTAQLALDQALDDAPDRLAASAVISTITWLLIRRGQIEECTRLATQWAADLEPRLSKATHRELSAWGWMLIRLALAAVRNNRPGEAADAMRLARAAALVVGREYWGVAEGQQRPFGPFMVTAKQAELEMIEDRPDRVLALSEKVPRNAIEATRDDWNRHLLDVANAQVRLGRVPDAVDTLLSVRSQAPEWLVQQRYARDVVRSIIERRRTLTPEIRGLADAVRLEY